MADTIAHYTFEESIEGWRQYSTNSVLERSLERARSGVASLKTTSTAVSRGSRTPLFDSSAYDVVEARAWIYASIATTLIVALAATPNDILSPYNRLFNIPAGVWTEVLAYSPGIVDHQFFLRESGTMNGFYTDDVVIREYVKPIPEPGPHGLGYVQDGIAAALRTILGLRVYDFPSDRVETPAAVLSLPETPYDVTFGGRNDHLTFPLWILVAKADDRAAYAEMTAYLEPEGPKSIRAVLEADRTLGGTADTSAVLNARPMFATVAGTEYLAVEFTLEVYT